MVIFHLDSDGRFVRYDPVLEVNGNRFIGLSSEIDYDENGNIAGVAKWIPGDYIVYYLEFSFTNDFNGGEITNYNIVSCGSDTRPWVYCSPGY